MRVRRALASGLVCALGTAPLSIGLMTAPASAAAPSAAAVQSAPFSVAGVAAPAASSSAHVPGASGSHVVSLQRALIARGFGIPAGATGYFGSQTKAAVAAFQRSQGWRGSGADGIPGSQTLARLGLGGRTAAAAAPVRTVAAVSAPSSGTYRMGAQGPHISTLQRNLIARGFGIPAGATGYFGSQTKAAVAAFQRSQGWRGSGADGIPGSQTLARLGGAAPVRATAAPTSALSPRAFVSRYGPVAKRASAATGVPALVSLAQAALESGWGGSAAGNNFFGVKARSADPASSRQLRTTYEVLGSPSVREFPVVLSVKKRSDGRYLYTVKDWFRTYSSADSSFQEHGLLLRNQRYRSALRYAADPYRFAAAIAAAGYATDPSYTRKLHDVMRLIQRNGFR